MSSFVLVFGSRGAPSGEAPILLEAATLDDAKMEAAMLYAGANFKTTPPTSFRILNDSAIVYRFPED